MKVNVKINFSRIAVNPVMMFAMTGTMDDIPVMAIDQMRQEIEKDKNALSKDYAKISLKSLKQDKKDNRNAIAVFTTGIENEELMKNFLKDYWAYKFNTVNYFGNYVKNITYND